MRKQWEAPLVVDVTRLASCQGAGCQSVYIGQWYPPDTGGYCTHGANGKPYFIASRQCLYGDAGYDPNTLPPAPTPLGWECPKCHRVWGPQVAGCEVCNREKDDA